MATIAVEAEHSTYYADDQVEFLQQWYDRVEHAGSIRDLLEAAGVDYQVIEYEQTDLHFYVPDLVLAEAKMLSAVQDAVTNYGDKAVFDNFQSSIQQTF